MEKRDFVKRFYAGMFFVIGIILILAVVFAIGIEKGMTQPKFQVKVLFKDIGGLSVGAPVRLSGVNVGTVGKIDFMEEKNAGRGVLVTLNIFRRYRKQVERSASFAIKTEGLLGGKIINMTADEMGRKIDLSQMIIGEDPLDVQDLAESFGDTAVSLTETSKGINSIIEELQQISKTSKRLLNRIEERLIEGNLFKVF
ncbi:MAG TPA: MlaD family protein [Candidatus Omnitrophota bacterium]|nr:MlaD family protein [Candidatus Omnitrophota bacterium]HPD84211.1 MlaD family protein [Candidatus Omnitrophota bacterium]HRZ03067.1 MlaD family protein [Candidatus Omnitrophota bacterium]